MPFFFCYFLFANFNVMIEKERFVLFFLVFFSRFFFFFFGVIFLIFLSVISYPLSHTEKPAPGCLVKRIGLHARINRLPVRNCLMHGRNSYMEGTPILERMHVQVAALKTGVFFVSPAHCDSVKARYHFILRERCKVIDI